MVKFVCPLTATSLVSYPVKVTTKTAFSATANSKAPSKFVDVPFLVPFSTMLAPGKGSLLVSTTLPEIFVCAYINPQNNVSIKHNFVFSIIKLN